MVAVGRDQSAAAAWVDPCIKTLSIAGQFHYQDQVGESMEFYRRTLESDPSAMSCCWLLRCRSEFQRYIRIDATH